MDTTSQETVGKDLTELNRFYTTTLPRLHRQAASSAEIAEQFGAVEGGRAALYAETAVYLELWWPVFQRFCRENAPGLLDLSPGLRPTPLSIITASEMTERLATRIGWAEVVGEVRNASTRFFMAVLNHTLFLNPPSLGSSTASTEEKEAMDRIVANISDFLKQGHSSLSEKNIAAYLIPGLRTAEQFIWETTQVIPEVYLLRNNRAISSAEFIEGVAQARFLMQQLAMLPIHVFTEVQKAISFDRQDPNARNSSGGKLNPQALCFSGKHPLRLTICPSVLEKAMQAASNYTHPYKLLTCPAHMARGDGGNIISHYHTWIHELIVTYVTPHGVRLGVLDSNREASE